jgi:acyl-CoA reductase-like NAD-dependent aldehyde dehydrogenase
VLGIRSIINPLAAGNTVVLKASELAPRTLGALASVLQEAGLPAGVLNVITHSPQTAPAITSALISDPRVKKVNFTGSTNTGRIIGRLAGENLKPVILELGGKAPAIVWDDADLGVAATQCALGAFLNAGQICMSTERIIVHKDIIVAFREKFAAAVENLFPAHQSAPILINSAAAFKNRKLVSDAVSKGATVLLGNPDAKEESDAGFRPIILDEVTKEMDIYQTESFGPSVSLLEVETEEEAIAIANDTEYGLSSAVFTEDLRRGLRFARGIEAGAVHINSMTVHDEPLLPHGGAKASGFGRFNTSSGLEEWVWTKNVTYDN